MRRDGALVAGLPRAGVFCLYATGTGLGLVAKGTAAARRVEPLEGEGR